MLNVQVRPRVLSATITVVSSSMTFIAKVPNTAFQIVSAGGLELCPCSTNADELKLVVPIPNHINHNGAVHGFREVIKKKNCGAIGASECLSKYEQFITVLREFLYVPVLF